MAKKWKTPYKMEPRLASRKERAAMTRVQLSLGTCRWCGGVFRNAGDRDACELIHRTLFRDMRDGIERAMDRIQRTPAKDDRDRKRQQRTFDDLAKQLKDIPDV